MAADKRTPQSKALGILELSRWTADVVERRITPILSRDFLGFIDIIALNPEDQVGVLALQVTSSNPRLMNEHVEKMLANENLRLVLSMGWRVELWGIGRKADRNGRYLKAKTFLLEDGELRVVDGSLLVDV